MQEAVFLLPATQPFPDGVAVSGEGMGQWAVGFKETTGGERACEKGLRQGVGGQKLAAAAYHQYSTISIHGKSPRFLRKEQAGVVS
jgi:hypothetical protein